MVNLVSDSLDMNVEVVTAQDGANADPLVATAYLEDYLTQMLTDLTEINTALEAIVAATSAYTPTNVTELRAYDANATSVAELADVLGTLIADLKTKGIIS